MAVMGDFSPASAQSGDPIRVIYSGENVRLKNISTRPIAAYEGTFSYEVTPGRVATPTWRVILPGAWFGSGKHLQPGQQEPFFPSSIPLPDNSRRAIKYDNVTVTGVLFADGTVWGLTGGSLRRETLSRAGATLSGLHDVWRIVKNVSPERLEQLLQGPGPIIEGQERGRWLHRLLQREMLDETWHMRPDALDRMKQMITNLENLIDR
jgi:hypothetical protein